jgi:hypothetical protein
MLAITRVDFINCPSLESYPAQVVELCAERADVVCWVGWII